MLEVCSLTKRYRGIPAVEDVSFRVDRGEIVGYLGPNGAGKSTTVKMIIGLLEPSEGKILFDGKSVLDDPASFQRRIGYVPEEPHLYPHLSGYEYLQLAGRLRGLSRAPLEHKIEHFLRVFSLWEDRYCPLSSYSKGMRQKVLLSAALLDNPELLILDEPFSGLDVATALALRGLLDQLAAHGKTIFFSSHVLEIVEKVCRRVLILRKGRVVADDSIDRLRELMHQPSFEAVFSQLAIEQGQEDLAGRILEAVES